MKNLWKKISLILAGAVVVLFFSNDFGLIDVEKTAIITAIGVDLAESGNFELTVQIAVPQVSSSQSENKKAIVSCEGDTVSFALHEIGTRTGWYPKLSFCNLIVLGEKMLNEGDVTAIVEYFARTVKIQDSAILTACEDTAKELLQVSTPLDNLSAFALQKILIKNPGQANDVFAANIKFFSIGLYSQSGASLIPYIRKIATHGDPGDKTGSPTESGSSSESGQSQDSDQESGGTTQSGNMDGGGGTTAKEFVFDATSSVLFNRGTPVGIMDSDMTLAMNFLIRRSGDTVYGVHDVIKNGTKENYLLTVTDNDCSLDLMFENGKPVMNVKAHLFAQIDDTTDRLDGASVADKFNLPPEVTEKAEKQFRETIYKIYDLAKQTGADIFKMKNKLYRFHHKYYEVMKEDLYERMEIRTDIRFAGRN